jgi:endonuclease YncB( thermonuclease family)
MTATVGWPTYHYRAKAVHVVDGDTVDLDLDFGAFLHRIFRCRLLGIDTPELHSSDESERIEAQRAKDVLARQLGENLLYVKTDLDKDDKYGRLLVTIYVDPVAEASLNRRMVEWGLAVPYIGWERV